MVKIRLSGLERSQIVYTMVKSGHMVLKEVNCVYNGKIRSNGLERSQLGTQCIKIRSYDLERTQLCIQ